MITLHLLFCHYSISKYDIQQVIYFLVSLLFFLHILLVLLASASG